jgi:hypothetical protein
MPEIYDKNSGPSCVKPSRRVGQDVGHDIGPGLLSMRPLMRGEPMAARAAENTKPNRITPELKTRLTTMTAELASRVKAVVARKP